MSELMRFRLARAPQKHAVDSRMHVSLYHQPQNVILTHVPKEHPLDKVVTHLLVAPTDFIVGFQKDGFTVLDKGDMFSGPVSTIEQWLTSVGNRPEIEKLSDKLREVLVSLGSIAESTLSGNAKLLIGHDKANWWTNRSNVALTLMVAMLRDKEPSRAMYWNRLMLVCGLIELAAQNPEALKNRDNIFDSLRWRTVLLPKPFMTYLQRGSLWLTSWGQGGR